MAAPDHRIAPAAPLVAPPAARRLRWLGDRGLAGLFISPALALLLFLSVFPLLWALYLSFTDYSATRDVPAQWIGLDNYLEILKSSAVRERGLMTTLFLVPMMLSPVVVGLFWRFMLDTQFGVVNSLLGSLGLGQVEWLTNQRMALISVVLV